MKPNKLKTTNVDQVSASKPSKAGYTRTFRNDEELKVAAAEKLWPVRKKKLKDNERAYARAGKMKRIKRLLG